MIWMQPKGEIWRLLRAAIVPQMHSRQAKTCRMGGKVPTATKRGVHRKRLPKNIESWWKFAMHQDFVPIPMGDVEMLYSRAAPIL